MTNVVVISIIISSNWGFSYFLLSAHKGENEAKCVQSSLCFKTIKPWTHTRTLKRSSWFRKWTWNWFLNEKIKAFRWLHNATCVLLFCVFSSVVFFLLLCSITFVYLKFHLIAGRLTAGCFPCWSIDWYACIQSNCLKFMQSQTCVLTRNKTKQPNYQQPQQLQYTNT